MKAGPFGTIVTISGITSLTVSYFYDFGFFFRLGTSFSEAPTTVIDHLQSWMIWLPVVVPLCVFLLTVFLAAQSKQRNSSESGSQAALPISTTKRRFRKVAVFLSITVTSLAVGYFLGDYVLPIVTAILLVWIWTIFIAVLYARQGSFRRRSTRLAGALTAIPSVIFIAFGLGYQNAHLKIQRNEPTHRVYSLASGNGSDTSFEDVRVVRVFALWMLVLEPNDSVVWLDLSHITKFRQLEFGGTFARLLCRLDIDCARH